jgi:outer membrane protein, heavy metal efflux system
VLETWIMSLKSVVLSFCLVSLARPAAADTPEARAASENATALATDAAADAEQPPPELMLEVWRVPLKRPYAVNDADMMRVGVEQEISAPGERSARKQAATLRARALRAEGDASARAVAERLAHARTDHWLAERSHQVHQAHLQLAQRTLELARARHAAGGPLADVTAAELTAAGAAADLAGDEARARASEQLVAALTGAAALPKTGERPELSMLRLAREAELADARAEGARSSWPDFRVGASYFAPTSGRDEHGFGVTLGMKLPWLWGSRQGRQSAAAARARALEQQLVAKRRDLAADVIEARGALAAAESTLQVLREQVLPLAERGTQLSLSAYQSGQAKLEDVLRAEAAGVDAEMELVKLEGEARHRQVQLAFLEGRPEISSSQGDDHVN